MEFVIKISQFLMSLSLLIILHELGHFIPAKLFKTRVEKFYLFFDVKFSLFKKQIGETVYGIGWLPLGGYVKISGMVDESMDTEQLKQEPQPWEFRSKPAWQRLIIMLGGVTVNFILAFLIYIGIAFTWGELYIKSDDVTNGIWVNNKVVENAGLQTGDKIRAVDGVKKEQFFGWNEAILLGKNIEVERNGEVKNIQLPVDFINQLSNGDRKSIVEMRIPFIVNAVEEGSLNFSTVKPLDRIVAFNGAKIDYADQVLSQVDSLAGRTVAATILRDEKQMEVQIKVSDSAKLGIYYLSRLSADNIRQLGLYPVTEKKYSLAESIPVGMERGWAQLANYGKQLQKIFNPSTGAYKEVGGFKAIFDIFPTSWSWLAFWNITALLSIMLGVMNLLPIPALDGGHVLFLLYEMITGRKPSDKFLENAQLVGFVLLIALLLFANGNDIYKAIVK